MRNQTIFLRLHIDRDMLIAIIAAMCTYPGSHTNLNTTFPCNKPRALILLGSKRNGKIASWSWNPARFLA